MRTVYSLLNRSEELVYRELTSIAKDNDLKLFAKPRLSDVLEKGKTHLTKSEFSLYSRGHFDFVITDQNYCPLMAIEYDGPFHLSKEQFARDQIKNDLCKRSGFGLLRINDRHVTKLYRGMTVLRWIVEVIELRDVFSDAQSKGHIPIDEDFDPAFIGGVGEQTNFPYWLSAEAVQSIHAFFRQFDSSTIKGWTGITGTDNENTDYRLSCLFFEDKILWSKVGVRKQGLDFPAHELLNELDTCELGLQLKKFRAGEIKPISKEQFRVIFDSFCEKYNARYSRGMGAFPFNGSFDLSTGWKPKS